MEQQLEHSIDLDGESGERHEFLPQTHMFSRTRRIVKFIRKDSYKFSIEKKKKKHNGYYNKHVE